VLDLRTALVVLHVSANLIWIGSISAVGYALTAGAGTPKVRGELGLEIYRKLAVPAFVLSFVTGVARLALDPQLYFVITKYMHPKLFLAVIAIVLHHVIGARAKRVARGEAEAGAGPARGLAVIVMICALGAAGLALTKPF
jgi:putative membrane protein